jgi:hypothetical protein
MDSPDPHDVHCTVLIPGHKKLQEGIRELMRGVARYFDYSSSVAEEFQASVWTFEENLARFHKAKDDPDRMNLTSLYNKRTVQDLQVNVKKVMR